jgi:hypothetical protein
VTAKGGDGEKKDSEGEEERRTNEKSDLLSMEGAKRRIM